MSPEPHEQVVIVTGASRGLGKEIARTLAASGSSVVLLARSTAAIEEVAQQIRTAGGAALAITCDVTDEAALTAAVTSTITTFGRLDALVNNAGISLEGPALDRTADDFRRMLDMNVVAGMTAAQAAVRAMRGLERGGCIVNVCSAAGLSAMPGLVHYGATKAALAYLTTALAVEWARYGVRVNAVAPGIIPTDLNAESLSDPKLEDIVKRRIPLRRFGEPAHVAEAVNYLLSPEASYLTGVVLPVDGGVVAAGGR